jgi:hypothetical protein
LHLLRNKHGTILLAINDQKPAKSKGNIEGALKLHDHNYIYPHIYAETQSIGYCGILATCINNVGANAKRLYKTGI